MRFHDRLDAGRKLVTALGAYAKCEPIVLALPRGGDVQADTAFDADRLQGDLLVAAADQHVGTKPDPDRGPCRGAAVVAGERATGDLAGGEDEPHDVRLLGEADIDAEFLHGARITFGCPIGPGKDAVQLLGRSEDEADAAGDVAGQ